MIFFSILLGGGVVATGVSLLLLFVFTTTLFNPWILLFIAAPIAAVGLIGLLSIFIWHLVTNSATPKTTPPLNIEKNLVAATKTSHQLNQNIQPTPEHQATQAVKSTTSSATKQTPQPTLPRKTDQNTLTKLKNFFDPSDVSQKSSEDFYKILGALNRDEKISAIQKITSQAERALFTQCIKDGASLEKLFSFLPDDIAKEQKEEIKNAAWATIDSDEPFFDQIMMSKEILGRHKNSFFPEREIIYNTIFLPQLLEIFPEQETRIIEKLFQREPSFYNNVLNYLNYYEKSKLITGTFSERHWPFFTAINELTNLEYAIKKSRMGEKNASIDHLIRFSKSVHSTQRPLLAKIIYHVFPDTQEEKIIRLTKKLAKLNDIFQNFLDSGSIEEISSEDIYYINNYFLAGKEKIFYEHSEMEEKILDQIIGETKFFTHLIKNTSDLIHVINQIDDNKKNNFIKKIINEQSGVYFKNLIKNVVDLDKLVNSLETATEAKDAVKNIVAQDSYFSDENFFMGANCQFKNISSEYVITTIYEKTINKPITFSKFINDYNDLQVMMTNLYRDQLFSAVKLLLSPEQSERFKKCICNGKQMNFFYRRLYFSREDKQLETEIKNALWTIIDSDLDFFKKIMLMGGGSRFYNKKYDGVSSSFNETYLSDLLEIFENHNTKIFQKLFLSDLSLYTNVLGYDGFFGRNGSSALFKKHSSFIEGVVELIALNHYVDVDKLHEKTASMQSLETICKQIPEKEKKLFLKVINDIFPQEIKEKRQIIKWIKQPSSRSIPTVTPSVYTQVEKPSPAEVPQSSATTENDPNKTMKT